MTQRRAVVSPRLRGSQVTALGVESTSGSTDPGPLLLVLAACSPEVLWGVSLRCGVPGPLKPLKLTATSPEAWLLAESRVVELPCFFFMLLAFVLLPFLLVP